MTPAEILGEFRAIEGRGLSETAPAPLITSDPSLLFVNAGITAVKQQLLGGADLPSQYIVQPSFRARLEENSLLAFDMLTLVGLEKELAQGCEVILRFVKRLYETTPGRLHGVFNLADEDLASVVARHGLPLHDLRANNSKYWVKWTFGAQERLVGAGGTIVWERDEVERCGAACDVLCACRKYIPLGNIVVLVDAKTARRYYDIGFGVQRLAAVFYQGEDVRVPPVGSLVASLEEAGMASDLACELARLIDGIAVLARQGVRPDARGHGYILRKLIRRVAGLLHLDRQPFGTEPFTDLLERHRAVLGEASSGTTPLVLAELQAYRAVIETNFNKASLFAARNDLRKPDAVLILRETFGLPTALCEQIIQARAGMGQHSSDASSPLIPSQDRNE